MFPGRPSIVLPAVTRPRLRAEILSRQRLLDLLYDLLERKLILVVAPAGYGKTSLLVDFAHQDDIQACWYTIDRFDQDFQRFAAHFIASIARQYPNFGALSTASLQSLEISPADIEPIVKTLVNELYESIDEHFVIILDDYHLVGENQLINAFVSRFVERVDDNCHLVIASRQQIDLPELEMFIGRGHAGRIDLHELAFSVNEAQMLSKKQKRSLTDAQASELVNQTEGWVTGILLAPMLSSSDTGILANGVRSNGSDLEVYWDRLFLDQPQEIRDFLLFTSLLNEFDARLCGKVLVPSAYSQGTDLERLCEAVLKRNLFVQITGEQDGWLRYHALFRDYLQARLEKEHLATKPAILQQLIDNYAAQGEWERAYNICKGLDDAVLTASIIEQAGPTLLKLSRFHILLRWIDDLPPSLIDADPGIMSLKGATLVMTGKVRNGIDLLNQAVSAFTVNGDNARLARSLTRRSGAYYLLTNYSAALHDAELALKYCYKDVGLLAEALKTRGISLLCLNQSTSGLKDINESLTLYRELNDTPNMAALYHELGIAYRKIGRLESARDAYTKAQGYWRQDNQFYRLADLCNNLGVLYHYLGEYEQASAVLNEGLKYARQTGFVRAESFILASLGDLYFSLQAFTDAENLYYDALRIAQRIENRFLCFYINYAMSRIARNSGDLLRSRILCETAATYSLPESNFEQGLLSLETSRLAWAEHRSQDAIHSLKVAIGYFKSGNLLAEEIEAQLYLAGVMVSTGEDDLARIHFLKAFDITPDNQTHLLHLTSIAVFVSSFEQFKHDPYVGQPITKLLQQLDLFQSRLPEVKRRLRKDTALIPPIQPKIVLRAFGGAQIVINGKEVNRSDWKSSIQREIIFYLLHHPEGASKTKLLDLIWGDKKSGANQLANMLYKMRRFLGEDLVEYRAERYYFNRQIDYDYDVERFLLYREQIRQETDPVMKANLYQQMTQLYQGTFLPEGSWLWIVPEQERLWQIYLDAALGLGEYYLDKGEYYTCLEICWQVLKHGVQSENIYRLAMRTAAAMGDRASVDHYYQLCRQTSRKTSGFDPSQETCTLYQQLMR